MQTETKDNSLSSALAWFASIVEMVDAMRQADTDAQDRDDSEDAPDKAREHIHQSVLSAEVRSGWHTPEAINDRPPEEYRILLTTGGPACQLVGTLNEYGEPETAELQHQDWGTRWTAVQMMNLAMLLGDNGALYATDIPASFDKAEAYLLDFARQFYFGEG